MHMPEHPHDKLDRSVCLERVVLAYVAMIPQIYLGPYLQSGFALWGR